MNPSDNRKLSLTVKQRAALEWLAGRIEAECEIHMIGVDGRGLFEQRVNAGLTEARDVLNEILSEAALAQRAQPESDDPEYLPPALDRWATAYELDDHDRASLRAALRESA